VSFSRTQQVKEFQAGCQTLTIWNNTYEEDHTSINSSQPRVGDKSISIPAKNRKKLHVIFV
jgi:hypothetical protein